MPDRLRVRVPPGRAGRLWLRGRLGVARRGRDLLDRKLRLLVREQQRLELLVQRTGDDWALACGEAEAWLLRAALLAGQRGLRLGGEVPPAEVTIAWNDTMGIRYPAGAAWAPAAAGDPPALLQQSAAIGPARDAHRAALAAAARHAASTAAARTVGEELAATRRRLRAIEDRWIPRLEATLSEVELALDEQERADGARLRRATAERAAPQGRTS